MAKELRLFIAVELPEQVRQELSQAQQALKAADADVSWPRPERMHLTLKFIGKTPPEHVEQLAENIECAAADCLAHQALLATQLGAFPNLRRIRVVWAALDEPTGELQVLQKRIDANTSWWVPPETRPYVPHLTLGRVKSGRNVPHLAQLIEESRLTPGLTVPVREVVLFQSELSPRGPTHTALHRARLSVL